MMYNTSYTENILAYVNNINTHEGGTHLTGFRRSLTTTLKKYADESGLLSKEKIEIAGDDFREGLTAIISVKVAVNPSRKSSPAISIFSLDNKPDSSAYYLKRKLKSQGMTSVK